MTETLGSLFNTLALKLSVLAGFAQGLAWSILSFIAIVWHLSARYDQFVVYQNSTYPHLLNSYMYYTFIKKDAPYTHMYIQPDGFFGVMIFYFFISLGWIGASVYAFIAYKMRYKDKRLFIGLGVWTAIACTNWILDLVFCIFLAVDYGRIVDLYSDTTDLVRKLGYTYSTIGYGIMIVLALRGVVLWFSNVALTAIMAKIFLQLKFYPPSEVFNEDITNTDSVRSRVHARNLPEEARNYRIEEVPQRRQTEPVLRQDDHAEALGSPHLYNYDPEVERRLHSYVMTPNRIKNRFRF